METSLFLFAVALVFFAHASERYWLAFGALGACVWVRPDALILVAVIAVYTAVAGRSADSPSGPGARHALVAGALIVGYGLFNRALGESWLPGTFAGKTAYYRVRPRSVFLETDVAQLATTHGWLLIAPFVVIAGVVIARRMIARRPAPLALEAGWAVALPLAYLVMLPYAHRFHRYLIPALPAIAIVGVAGLKHAHAWIAQRKGPWPRVAAVAVTLILVGATVRQGQGAVLAADLYASLCDYHRVRHERTAHWIARHTPKRAVIATHDIGAIAFYSGRRVVDLVGLVLPEVTVHLHTPGYARYLRDLFDDRGVTHVAALRNWLEVDNVAPLFVADPQPEIMEVYPWDTERAHLVEPRITALRERAASMLGAGRDVVGAIRMLQHVTTLDPKSARSWLLVATAAHMTQRPDKAELAYRRVLAVAPGHPVATARLAALRRAP